MGERALKAALAVVWPVPPLAMPKRPEDKNVAIPTPRATIPAMGRPTQLVRVPEDGVPRAPPLVRPVKLVPLLGMVLSLVLILEPDSPLVIQTMKVDLS